MQMQPSTKPPVPARKHRLYRAFQRALFQFSYKSTLCGFDVAMFLPTDEDKVTVFSRIEEALNLIATFAPHRLAQMRRHVKRIWVFGIPPYQAVWEANLEACILDRAYVRRTNLSVESLAASLVHESTHARISSAGIRYREELRARIERLCVKSELWLGQRLPNGEAVVKDAKAGLRTPTNFWSNRAFDERSLKVLRDLGKDNWVSRLICKATEVILARRRTKPRPSSFALDETPRSKNEDSYRHDGTAV